MKRFSSVFANAAVFAAVILALPAALAAQNPKWRHYKNGNYITAMVNDGVSVWAASEAGLYQINKTTGAKKLYNKANSKLPANDVRALAVDANKNVWVGTYGGGLAKFDGVNNFTVFNKFAIPQMPSNFITALAVDGSGNIWMGAEGDTANYLAKFNGANNWTVYNDKNTTYSLRGSAHGVDSHGQLWIRVDDGVAKFDGTKWTLYFKSNSGFPGGGVSAFAFEGNTTWIATSDKGLVKFDGTNWTVYNTSNTPQLPSNQIRCLVIDGNGNKWIGTATGLAKFNGTNWTFYPTPTITSLAIGINGTTIWIGTDGGGLGSFDGANWTVYDSNNSGLPSDYINSIAIDRFGNKWIGAGAGLAKFDGANWKVYTSSDFGASFSAFVTSLAIDRNNSIWIGLGYSSYNSDDPILIKFDGTNWTRYYDDHNSGLYGLARSLSVDNSGNLWIGHDNGITKFDGTNWTTRSYAYTGLPDRPNSLAAKGSTIYIGTYFGATKFDGANWTFYDEGNSGLASRFVNCLAFDNNDNLWIGTDYYHDKNSNPYKGGLVKFDGANWTRYTSANSGLPFDGVLSIAFDGSNNIWVGTYLYEDNYSYSLDGALAKFDRTNWTVYSASNSNLPSNIVTALAGDGNSMWIGGYPYYDRNDHFYRGGVAKFDGAGFTSFEEAGLPSNEVTAIAIDPKGNKWIGTRGAGVAKFDGAKWTVYDKTNSALPTNRIRSLAFDSEGNIWIGTEAYEDEFSNTEIGGVVKFDGANWALYNHSDFGLPPDEEIDVTALAFDANGNLWMGTDYGLAKFDGDKWNFYDTPIDDYYYDDVLAIDGNENVWTGARAYVYNQQQEDGGLAKFDGVRWRVFNTSNSPLTSNDVTALVSDGKGNLWVGTHSYEENSFPHRNIGGGLAKFDGTNWTVYSSTSNPKLPSNDVNSLAVDGSGNIWVGTDAGLFKFDGTSFTSYNTSNSELPDNEVGFLAADGNGNIWMTTDINSDDYYLLYGENVLSVFNEAGVSLAPFITVNSPNGGQTLQAGSTQKISWTSSNAANVKLEYSTNNGLSWNKIVDSTPASTGSYDWKIPGALAAFCKVRISDVASNSRYDVSDKVFAINTVQFAATPQIGADLNVSVTPPPNFQPTSRKLYYRPGGAKLWQQVDLTTSGGNDVGKIPASALTIRGLEYYVVYSNGTTTVTYPTVNPQIKPAAVQVQLKPFNAPVTLPPKAYKMISVPAALDENKVDKILGDDYGAYDPKKWRLFRWQNGGYAEHPNLGANFTPGAAFWLITLEGQPFDVENGWSVKTSGAQILTLQPGWNQIGHPFAFSVAWDSVRKENGQVQAPVKWNGEDYEYNQKTLQPWEGYLVYNPNSHAVRLSVPPRESVGLSKETAAWSKLSEKEFVLQIKAQGAQTGWRDEQNFVGMLAGAGDELDAQDFLEAPPIGDYLRLSLVEAGQAFAGNFKAVSKDGGVWDLQIAATGQKENIRLSFNKLAVVPAGFQIWLLDKDRRQLLSVHNGQLELEGPAKGETRHLRLIIGTAELARKSNEGISLVPLEYALLDNYPNPFNRSTERSRRSPTTRIEYHLPERSEVKLEIYNVLGQKLRTLVNVAQEAGIHIAVWDGRDDFHQPVASGVYLYRLHAGKFTATKKMALVQ